MGSVGNAIIGMGRLTIGRNSGHCRNAAGRWQGVVHGWPTSTQGDSTQKKSTPYDAEERNAEPSSDHDEIFKGCELAAMRRA
jgi:hypothetical protein